MVLSVGWNLTEELRAFGWSPSVVQGVTSSGQSDSEERPSEDCQAPPVRPNRPVEFLDLFVEWSVALLNARIAPLRKESKRLARARRILLQDICTLHTSEAWTATIATIRANREAITQAEQRLRKNIDQAVSAQREADARLVDFRKAVTDEEDQKRLEQLVKWADAREKHNRMYNLVLENRHDVAAAYLVNGLTISVFMIERWQIPLHKLLLKFLQDTTAIWGRIAQSEHAHRNEAVSFVTLGHQCAQTLIADGDCASVKLAEDLSADFKTRRHSMKKILLASRTAESDILRLQSGATGSRLTVKDALSDRASSSQATLCMVRQCLEHADNLATHPLRAFVQNRSAAETFLHQHRTIFTSVQSLDKVGEDSQLQRDILCRNVTALTVQWLQRSILTHDDETALESLKVKISETYREIQSYDPLDEIQTSWFSMSQTRTLPSLTQFAKKRVIDHDAITQALSQIQDCAAMLPLKAPEPIADEMVTHYLMQSKGKAKVLVDVDDTPWIPAGTEVEILLPARTFWLIRYANTTLQIPATYLEGFGTTTPTNLDVPIHLKRTHVLPTSAELLRSISSGSHLRVLFDFEEALLRCLHSKPKSRSVSLWSGLLETPGFSRVSMTSMEDLTAAETATIKSGAGSVVRRRVDPFALNRSTTAVTTYGRFRPINDEQEFSWRFSYDNPDSQVLAQYNCALSAKILLQGKLYITTTAVAFYSAFNENTIMSTIPTQILFELKDIVNIQKKVFALIFNNAIEFTLKDGDKYLFTSFVRRDKAWATLMMLTKYKYESPELSRSVLSKRIFNLLESGNPLSSETRDEDAAGIVIPANVQPLPSTKVDGWPDKHYRFQFPVGQFPLPVHIVFDKLILASEFLERVNEIQGNKNTQQGDWVPEVKPEVPISSYLGQLPSRACSWDRIIKRTAVTALLGIPEYAHVEETSTLHVHPDLTQILLESRDVASGPPYTNCFVVLARAHLTALSESVTQFDLEMDFEWSESCWVRGKIEEGTVAEWIENCRVVRQVAASTLCGCTVLSETEVESFKGANLSRCLTQWANYLLDYLKQLKQLYIAATLFGFVFLTWRLGQIVLHLTKRMDELEMLMAGRSHCF